MKRDALKTGLSEIRILIFKRCENLPLQWAASLVAGTLLCVSTGGGSIAATGFVSAMNTDFQGPSNDISALPLPSAGIIGVRHIRLYPHGFEPKEITVKEGRFLLAVDNRSGFVRADITFRLGKVGTKMLREARLPLRKRGWREVVDFSPGTYVLTEVNHPKWTCEITIVPR